MAIGGLVELASADLPSVVESAAAEDEDALEVLRATEDDDAGVELAAVEDDDALEVVRATGIISAGVEASLELRAVADGVGIASVAVR